MSEFCSVTCLSCGRVFLCVPSTAGVPPHRCGEAVIQRVLDTERLNRILNMQGNPK
jgi:hypothetical protein